MSLLETLWSNPLLFFLMIGALLLALSLHEYAHACMAAILGDRTAERMGRLTMNPLVHIDPIGFFMLLIAGFGWAKPVPYNPYNLRDQRWGPLQVAAAGPLMNFVLGAVAAIGLRLFAPLGPDNGLIIFFYTFAWINFALMLFNLIPVPPLDGSKALYAILSHPKYRPVTSFLEHQGSMVLFALILLDAFTNLGVFSWIGRSAIRLVSLISGLL
jgi:Zn-dependent protease